VVAVRVAGLTKRYGVTPVVDDVSFVAEDAEFVTLLGPSGCGKTTTLRCIAGLERPDGGTISIHDAPVCGPGVFVPIHKREIGMVFQSYAVWPHMTVAENVGFPLKLRKIRGTEGRDKIAHALDLVALGDLGSRYPYELSGGQQQRVALARALVYDPRVLLLDEPLSNLDAKLREQMRGELRAVQRRIGVTTIYVTHDQAEAMELSDTIVVMNAGHVEQIGNAMDVYRTPASPFVRTFVGLVNELSGRVRSVIDGTSEVDLADVALVAACPTALLPEPGQAVQLWIRPEDLIVARDQPSGATNTLPARVSHVVFQGSWIEYRLTCGSLELRAVARADEPFSEGDTVWCQLPVERLHLDNGQGNE
jgi:iron(III) transport system ATP-binding protein